MSRKETALLLVAVIFVCVCARVFVDMTELNEPTDAVAWPWSTWDGELAVLPARVINLASNPERWHVMAQKVVPLLPRLRRADAVNGKARRKELLSDPTILSPATRDRLENGRLRWDVDALESWGAVGCALSHINLWREMVEAKTPLLLVLEDDMEVTAADIQHVKDAFQRNKSTFQDTSVWFLDHTLVTRLAAPKPASELLREKSRWSAASYIMTLPAARKLLAQSSNLDLAVDKFMGCVNRVGDIECVVHPDVRLAGNGRTSTIPRRWAASVQLGVGFGVVVLLFVIVSSLLVWVLCDRASWIRRCQSNERNDEHEHKRDTRENK